MNIRLIAATTAVCTLMATGAYAGSPYYGDGSGPMTPRHMTTLKRHVTARSRDAVVPVDSDYRATAPESVLGTTTPAPTVANPVTGNGLGPDGYEPVQANPQFFNHAEGTMGAQ